MLKNKESLLVVAKLVLAGHEVEFSEFYNSYFYDKNAFITQNVSLVENNENFDFENLRPIELFYVFAASKNLVFMTDWKGEENEYEIEDFLETLLPKPSWENAATFRKFTDKNKLKRGRFIIGLLNALDKDLQTIDHRLIFLDLGWDAYVYTCIKAELLAQVVGTESNLFHGVEKLQ